MCKEKVLNLAFDILVRVEKALKKNNTDLKQSDWDHVVKAEDALVEAIEELDIPNR